MVDPDAPTSELSSHEVASDLVSGPVPYRVLRPGTGPPSADAGRPLLVFLHGGGGAAEFLDVLQPVFDRLWATGALPPLVVATPSAGRSFYLDRFDGRERWEQFLHVELIPHLVATTGAGRGGAAVAIAGVSMGGLGALRVAFRHPEQFVAVAAVEPGIEESPIWTEVARRDRVYRDDALMRELFGADGGPVDAEHFWANHPRTVAEHNGHRIAAAGLAIYLECGDQDLLHLQYGAEALHRQLFAHGIDHDYRLVRGADHLGPTLLPRIGDALTFVGHALAALDEPPPEPDPLLEMFRAFITPQELDRGYRRTEIVAGPAGPTEVHVMGEGPTVVLLPSLGRGAADFQALAARLARAGFQAVAPEPRGLGASTGHLDSVTMADLADDVAAVIRAVADGPATVVGHAFGNRVARMVATAHPDLVDSVVLLACGGLVPPAPEVSAALAAVFDPALGADDHLDAVRTAFFAPGNDPTVWADGWFGGVAAAQAAATAGTPVDTWWTAGRADVLVVQPADDVVAAPANGTAIVDALGSRASMITIPDAGHALLPEQPAAVATALLTWLDRRARTPPVRPAP